MPMGALLLRKGLNPLGLVLGSLEVVGLYPRPILRKLLCVCSVCVECVEVERGGPFCACVRSREHTELEPVKKPVFATLSLVRVCVMRGSPFSLRS